MNNLKNSTRSLPPIYLPTKKEWTYVYGIETKMSQENYHKIFKESYFHRTDEYCSVFSKYYLHFPLIRLLVDSEIDVCLIKINQSKKEKIKLDLTIFILPIQN